MAGDWIKMRGNLPESLKVDRMSMLIGNDRREVLVDLYRLANWFASYGKYGKLQIQPRLIDVYLKCDGFADALAHVGWLRDHKGVLTLHEFCDVSTRRKSLGAKVRAQVLAAGKCAACASTVRLEVDHKTPVSRGGSCETDNLQALCKPCNVRKGRKTMAEFVA